MGRKEVPFNTMGIVDDEGEYKYFPSGILVRNWVKQTAPRTTDLEALNEHGKVLAKSP
jgi:hypothetical protein